MQAIVYVTVRLNKKKGNRAKTILFELQIVLATPSCMIFLYLTNPDWGLFNLVKKPTIQILLSHSKDAKITTIASS